LNINQKILVVIEKLQGST